ncbi:response regulator [Microlunatus soli]|uniref:DNA-binding response regulator, NarL/FixJ family, contains REC and HTH domains n=1 Tax=Microlunatus soli TaxID=630515 RepID=A0A1H1WG93_9ACTN|nr:response regulator transcription factor [Microlunatus soli]SDS96052.1 DNA-binding response regulator, NarL/FixJ family, contains REC and HTH domains [Microlunatus soli]
MITTVLVDDQEVVRAGLRALATRDGDIEVVAEAADGRSGVATVIEHRPDLVLMDIRMPIMDGLEATREIVADRRAGDTKVVILTTFDEDENVFAAIRAGAAGYLLKDVSPDQLRSAIRTVAAGDALLSPSVTRTVMDTVARAAAPRTELITGLSPRDREILTHVGLGLTNAEIGTALQISPATARTYVSRLLRQLGARDRSGLVIIAYESGLVVPGGS